MIKFIEKMEKGNERANKIKQNIGAHAPIVSFIF